MAKKISDFLEELAKGSQLELDFDQRPRKAMKDFGLDEDQQMLILGGTTKQLRAALKSETGKDVLVFRVKRG